MGNGKTGLLEGEDRYLEETGRRQREALGGELIRTVISQETKDTVL